jgi:hypothetical protein
MYSPNAVKKKKCLPNLTILITLMKVLFEYLREIETELENSLECESGVHMGSIYEKKRRPKFSCNCPFNARPE